MLPSTFQNIYLQSNLQAGGADAGVVKDVQRERVSSLQRVRFLLSKVPRSRFQEQVTCNPASYDPWRRQHSEACLGWSEDDNLDDIHFDVWKVLKIELRVLPCQNSSYPPYVQCP